MSQGGLSCPQIVASDFLWWSRMVENSILGSRTQLHLRNKHNSFNELFWIQRTWPNSPVSVNGWRSLTFKMYASNVPKITAIAFRPRHRYFRHSFSQTLELSFSCIFLLYFSFCGNAIGTHKTTTKKKNPHQITKLESFTFNVNNRSIVRQPSTVSHSCVWPMLRITFLHAGINSLVVPFNPNNDLIWLLPIVSAAAVVNPTVT